MDILQFIMGFIMGIYLMEILSGHLAMKTVLVRCQIGGFHSEGRIYNNFKNHVDDKSD